MITIAQKRWVNDVAEWFREIGFNDFCLDGYNFQIHHCGGRKLKHNKVAIGHWFILPLPFELHDVSSNSPVCVTHHKHAFTDMFGLQSELFKEMIESMVDHGATLPFGQDVIDAIMDTRK